MYPKGIDMSKLKYALAQEMELLCKFLVQPSSAV